MSVQAHINLTWGDEDTAEVEKTTWINFFQIRTILLTSEKNYAVKGVGLGCSLFGITGSNAAGPPAQT
jgi:hypothetical protein